jgi:hypothetical protein
MIRLEHPALPTPRRIAVCPSPTLSGGVAIRIDKPWEGVTFGGSVLHHRGRYLLYYSASPVEDDVDALCVATSEDGVTLTKPVLGLVSYVGSRDNVVAFRKIDPQPALVSHLGNCFDGGNTMFWSEAEGQYVQGVSRNRIRTPGPLLPRLTSRSSVGRPLWKCH